MHFKFVISYSYSSRAILCIYLIVLASEACYLNNNYVAKVPFAGKSLFKQDSKL